MFDNIILATDSYKASHYLQYPPKTQTIVSYIEARGVSKSLGYDAKDVCFVGLQPLLEFLAQPVTLYDITDAERVLTAHGLPFNRAGWERIVKVHKGFLPVKIEAIPEGMVVPLGTPLVQVRNTDPELPWLTSYLETILLRAVWYPTTVATISRHAKQIIKFWLRRTADDPDTEINFKLHDFGARGVSSGESAALGGLAHLVNFMGTDTLEGLIAATTYYGNGDETFGFSIPAAEHSTITSWGKDREVDAYRNMLKQFASPGKLVAVVSDSYNIFEAASKLWGEELKEEVIKSGATVVIRPDSGDPVTVIRTLLFILGEKFGVTTNTKGYKVLPPYIRIIQGDGVNLTSINDILSMMEREGYSASNIAFGMGGALLQKCDRDTFKFAMKACAAEIDGVWTEVYKDPVTDKGKRSKRGIQYVYEDGDDIVVSNESQMYGLPRLMVPVFENGTILVQHKFNDLRERANKGV